MKEAFRRLKQNFETPFPLRMITCNS